MVVERTRRQLIQVRHGVTTNPTDLLTREWSIIGQQDVMVYRIRDYLDADGLIGQPIYDTTLIQVKASCGERAAEPDRATRSSATTRTSRCANWPLSQTFWKFGTSGCRPTR